MAIPIRYIVQVTLVIFLVSVTSSRGDSDGAVSDEGSQDDSGAFLSTVIENFLATNLGDKEPDPEKLSELVTKEVQETIQELTVNLPKLLQNPFSYIAEIFLHIAAVVLAIVSFVPPLALPARVVALILSVLSILIGSSGPINSEYLSEL
ncbi:hypothetical protein L798_01139 [Zootermopsis nevadensis]|uniref:Uncharacterized protein n=1 Tax=Zootermopsis nevadensis TaxID=136037 RepID=A0A067QW32_ZOONE|nr:hypothetical protein L798_01139 [Zootermopsis nevadensis]